MRTHHRIKAKLGSPSLNQVNRERQFDILLRGFHKCTQRSCGAGFTKREHPHTWTSVAIVYAMPRSASISCPHFCHIFYSSLFFCFVRVALYSYSSLCSVTSKVIKLVPGPVTSRIPSCRKRSCGIELARGDRAGCALIFTRESCGLFFCVFFSLCGWATFSRVFAVSLNYEKPPYITMRTPLILYLLNSLWRLYVLKCDQSETKFWMSHWVTLIVKPFWLMLLLFWHFVSNGHTNEMPLPRYLGMGLVAWCVGTHRRALLCGASSFAIAGILDIFVERGLPE